MSWKEVSYLVKKSEEEFIDKWNRTRYICYSIIQSQSTSRLEPKDIMTFPWEVEEGVKPSNVKSKEELIKYALDLENKLNNGR